jgi:hypothetical protein
MQACKLACMYVFLHCIKCLKCSTHNYSYAFPRKRQKKNIIFFVDVRNILLSCYTLYIFDAYMFRSDRAFEKKEVSKKFLRQERAHIFPPLI